MTSILSSLNTSDPSKTIAKVLYFYNGSALGGGPLSLLYLVQKLDPSKFHPVVLCLYDSEVVTHFRSKSIDTFIAKGIEEINHTTAGWYPLYNPLRVLQLLKKLIFLVPSALRTKRIIEEHKVALVHLNSLTLLPSAIGARLAGVPLVWHVRESVRRGHLGIRKRLLRWLVNLLADEVVYICEDNQQRLGSEGVIIYNFVDFQKFDRNLSGKAVREQLHLNNRGKVVLMLGGISRIKGTMELVKAISIVRDKISNVRCIIAGCQPPHSQANALPFRIARRLGYRRYTEQVREFVKKEDLQQHITFLPFRTDVPELIAASDLVVFPSTSPHFARPAIEAGAMAKPVVASRIGGVEEIVKHKMTGLLTPPRDVQALADAISQVLKDDDLANEMGDGGFDQATRLFDANVNVEQTVSIYERLLSRTPAAQSPTPVERSQPRNRS